MVTNVTHFGAFVDIGVHQGSLVHISQMSSNLRDPRETCAVGQHVEVSVLELMPNGRIALVCATQIPKNGSKSIETPTTEKE